MINPDIIAVIIPTFNRARQVLEGLASVYSQENVQVQAIVINDGSKDGTSALVKEKFPQARIIEGNGNLWWGGAINAGLQQALDSGFNYFLLLNDDNRLAPLALSHLLDYARSNPGTIAGSLVRLQDTNLVSDAGVAINWWKGGPYLLDFKQEYAPDKYSSSRNAESLGGQGVLLSREIILKVGLLNHQAFPQYFGDTDFYLRARAKGIKIVVNPASQVWNELPAQAKAPPPANLKEALGRFIKLYSWTGSPYYLKANLRFLWRYCPKYILPVAIGYRFLSSFRYYNQKYRG